MKTLPIRISALLSITFFVSYAFAYHASAKEVILKDRTHCGLLPMYAKKGDIETIKSCVAKGTDVNIKGSTDHTALYSASEMGHIEIAEYLIANGADVNAINDKYRLTPLHIACWQAHKNIVELLIANGAQIGDRTSEKYGYYTNASAISYASMGGDADIVRILIGKGADVNEKNTHGITPLHFAAEEGRVNVAELLIAGGAEVNAEDEDGLTPLGYAAVHGNRDVEKILITNGAKVYSKKNHYGQYRLHGAVFDNNINLAKQLIAGNADVNQRMSDGESDLLYDWLISDNISGQDGHTPLHEAANFGRAEIAELLIADGASVDAESDDYTTPLMIAAFRGNVDVARVLIANGADIDSGKSRKGLTPLICASLSGHIDVVKILISSGADINYHPGGMISPLFAAFAGRHKDIAEVLIDNGAYIINDRGEKTFPEKKDIESLFSIGGMMILEALFNKLVDRKTE